MAKSNKKKTEKKQLEPVVEDNKTVENESIVIDLTVSGEKLAEVIEEPKEEIPLEDLVAQEEYINEAPVFVEDDTIDPEKEYHTELPQEIETGAPFDEELPAPTPADLKEQENVISDNEVYPPEAQVDFHILPNEEHRVFKIDVGQIPEEKVEEYIQSVAEKFKEAVEVPDLKDFGIMLKDEDVFIPEKKQRTLADLSPIELKAFRRTGRMPN